MKILTIDLTELELAYLIFWYASFDRKFIHTPGEKELFHRLFLIYSNNRPELPIKAYFTPKPPYQPGDGPEDGSGNCAPVVFLGE